MTWDDIRQIALSFPGVEERLSWGTPAFFVRKKFLGRIHEKLEDTFVIHVDDALELEYLLENEPETYYITDHYRGWPGLLMRISKGNPADLRNLFEEAWRRRATKRQIEEYESRRTDRPAD